MTKHISTASARRNLDRLLDSVQSQGDEIVVERSGSPIGVIIPVYVYDRLKQDRSAARENLRDSWSRRPVANDIDASEAEILAETEAVRYGL